jgi:hypothetical protein
MSAFGRTAFPDRPRPGAWHAPGRSPSGQEVCRASVSGRDADELDPLGTSRVGTRDEGALQPHVAFGRLEPDG